MVLIDVEFKDMNSYKNIPMYTHEEIDEKYKIGEKRLVTEQGRYPLDSLSGILEKSIRLDPDYQRSFVWTNVQKSRLIESFIMNIPVPPVFLYEVQFASYEVMDGRQRLSTIRDFYEDKFILEGLEVWGELNGLKYSSLPKNVRLGIDRRYISTIVILNETAKSEAEEFELKQHVFERLNTGGAKLTDQEIRNAIMRGPMNDFCKKVALEENLFQKIFRLNSEEITLFDDAFVNEINPEKKYVRMEDVELVLRFFAYRQIESNPMSSVKDILDLYLVEANQQIIEEEQYTSMSKLFHDTLELGIEIFGDHLYKMYTYKKKIDSFSWNNVPTKLLYDPVNHILSKYLCDGYKVSKKNNVDFEQNLKRLFIEHASIFNGRNNGKSYVIQRIELLKQFFSDTLELKRS